jgi:hypothetical protein
MISTIFRMIISKALLGNFLLDVEMDAWRANKGGVPYAVS